MTRAIEFVLWQPVYHNKEFSHHRERRVIVKGCIVHEAKKKIRFRPATTNKVSDSLTITSDNEYIQSVRDGKIVTYTRFEPFE